MLEMQRVRLPPDVEYFLDSALEHTAIDATTHIVLSRWGLARDLMDILDGAGPDDRPPYKGVLPIARRLSDLADTILPRIEPRLAAAVAWAGARHMRKSVRDLAWHYATCAHEDQIVGGCMEPYKRRLTRRAQRYELTAKQARRLNAPQWIKAYVKRDEEAHSLRAMGVRVTRRLATVGDLDAVRLETDGLLDRVAAEHDAYRRTNEQRIAFEFIRRSGGNKAEQRRHRARIKRAAKCASEIIGADVVSRFCAGGALVLPGEHVSLEVRRRGSAGDMGHGGLIVAAVDPQSHRLLARLCVYHEKMPALDQVVALSLAMAAGDERAIVDTANIIEITDLGMGHPWLTGRAKVRGWEPRDDQKRKNEAYWDATKPLWVKTLGVFVMGRTWATIERAAA